MPDIPDDDFEANTEALYDSLHGGEMSSRDAANHAERLKANPNDEPKPFDTVLREDAEAAYKELEDKAAAREYAQGRYSHWHKLAKQHGMAVHDYLDRVYNMEQTINRNPAEGVAVLARNMGVPVLKLIEGLVPYVNPHSGGHAPQVEHATHANNINAAIAAFEKSVPDFAQHEEMMAAILSDRRFERTGNHLRDIQRSYMMAKRFSEDAAIAKAKAANSISRGPRTQTPEERRRSEEREAREPAPRRERSFSDKYEADLKADVEAAWNAVKGA